MGKVKKSSSRALPELPKRSRSVKQCPATLYLDSLEESGRRAMGILLNKVASMYGYESIDTMPWENLRYEHLAKIKSKLRTIKNQRGLKYSERTINMAVYAVRGVAKVAFNIKLLDIDNLQRLNQVKPLKIERLPAGRAVDMDELELLFNVCREDEKPAGIRDLAILNCLYIAGLRRSEIAKLTIDSFIIRKNKRTGERHAEFRFIGKGAKEAVCPIDDTALDTMDSWLVLRGFEPGPLFCSITKGGSINLQRHMSEQSIYNIVRSRSNQAGIPPLSPHDMRRSLATDLLNKQKEPIKRVQQIMRHSDIRTTAIYIRDDEEENRIAISSLRN